VDGWRPACDIGARRFGQMSDDIANHSNQVRETAGKFYVLWRGQAVTTPDKKIRLFDTEREAYEFLAQCDNAGGIVG
jgi:hypothetical protein